MELGHLLAQHGGDGSVLVGLRLCLERPGFDGRQGLTEHPCAHGSDPVEQLAAGLLGVDFDSLAGQHVAGVEALVHLHDGDARLGVAVQHRPLHGGAATIFRQQGDVEVDAAVFRRFQHRSRQDAAVGHHDDELRSQRADVLVLAAVPQGAGLKDGGAVGQRHFLHRGCGEHLLAAHGLIAPGVDRADVVARLIQGFQAVRRNIRRPHEQNAHQSFSFFLAAAARPSSVSS